MTRNERLFGIGTTGLAFAALGAFLPWARVGGRNRSGFSTADTFISLSTGALPDALAWVGRWWYAPAFLALAAWATLFATAHWAMRAAGVMAVAVALTMWWLFVWAGENWGVLDTQLIGPVVSTVGLVTIGAVCAIRQSSVLRA